MCSHHLKRTKVIYDKAAAYVAALLFLFIFAFAPLIFAAKSRVSESKSREETFKNIIEKSRNLTLQQDRTQATQILINALKKENRKSQAFVEMSSVLDEVSMVFYTEKAQQVYELALSSLENDLVISQSRLQEGLRLEPNNLILLIQIGRTFIGANDCAQAQTYQQKARDVNPWSTEVDLLAAQTALCLDQRDKYFAIKSTLDPKVYSQNIYWLSLESEVMNRAGQLEIAKEHATTVTKLEPNFPEGYLMLYKILEKQKMNANEPGKKYLQFCKSLTHKLRRQWIFEPRLCREVNDIELALKKKGGPSE